jgi:hypothetical protein
MQSSPRRYRKLSRPSRATPPPPSTPITRKRGWAPSEAVPVTGPAALVTPANAEAAKYASWADFEAEAVATVTGESCSIFTFDLQRLPLSRKPGLALLAAVKRALAVTRRGVLLFYVQTRKTGSDTLLPPYPPTHHMSKDAPPPKRRRLTDTIISTAVSVALVGTAVGLTAYRLWRDRGKAVEPPVPEQPPPYTEQEWSDDATVLQAPNLFKDCDWILITFMQPPAAVSFTASPMSVPGPSRRRPRPTTRRTPTVVRARRQPIASGSRGPSPAVLIMSGHDDEDASGEFGDQMDWMSDRLRGLIEEGKRALGKEIVIMTEGVEDEEASAIDDGAEGWEEEDADERPKSRTGGTRPGSRNRMNRRPSALNLSSSLPSSSSFTFHSPMASPRPRRALTPGAAKLNFSRPPSSPRLGPPPATDGEVKVLFEPSDPRPETPTSSSVLDEGSRQLRESMERVRKAYGIGQ